MSGNASEFSGRTILISGACSGVGAPIARMLAECGARLLLLGRNQHKLNTVLASLSGSGHESILANLEEPIRIADQLRQPLAEFGPVYGFCHVAGVVHTLPLNGSKPEIVAEQMNVNVLAGLELARLVSSRSVAQSGGSAILFISSIYSSVGAPGQIAYCASKGAINSAVRAMAIELAPRKIRVNSLSPGFIRTDMTAKHSKLSESQMEDIISRHPLGEGKPEDAARAAVFLLDPANSWITGTDLVIDGGYTVQ